MNFSKFCSRLGNEAEILRNFSPKSTSLPRRLLALFLCLITAPVAFAAVTYVPATVEPPAVQREFRGVWVATVNNIDWPSKPGLPVPQQKEELRNILDRAVKLNLNAVIFQVRPACDAFYDSKLEPWSQYLTGTAGAAPSPYYDPLAFAVEEAHQRGLELHAWFNPYRVAQLALKPSFSTDHISQTHPELVRAYGTVLWLDPGEKKVQEYSLGVVMDVVRRYDIDGVHLDDYFYPYQQTNSHGVVIDFPDDASWKKYGEGGKLSRDDWRRENVNNFVRSTYEAIKAEKPWVKFGISPFGIWQPGYPKPVNGMNAYTKLYADSRKWLHNGWVDYFTPQLYWPTTAKQQGFSDLLKWWVGENPMHRNLWPGLFSEKVGEREGAKWPAAEIVKQIKLTRQLCDAPPGEVQFSMRCLLADRAGLATALAKGVYAEPALVPASPWLEDNRPARPELTMDGSGVARWQQGRTNLNTVALWVLQTRLGGHWRTRILPEPVREELLNGSPEIVAVTAIDRCGVASPVMALKAEPDAPHSRQDRKL
jgi:uncharacterized lipoprotein YddW (UPF0748 family)